VGTIPYTQTFSATPAGTTYIFAVTAGTLPPGLSLNGTSGILSGTVTAAGNYSFTITATGWGTCTGSRSYTLTAVCPALSVSPSSLPAALAGTAYSQPLTATGGTAPYAFAVTSGALPTGLTLSEGGVLSGTPTAGGAFTFTVTVTDTYGCSASRTYTIAISSFDLSFFDDLGRSRICANSVTGDWKWTVLQGPGIGTYTGSGIPSWFNNVLTITAPGGLPYTLSLKYMKLYHKASGSFSYPAKRVSSPLTDSNTLNDPPGC
jgi:hypothetical protein